MAKQVIVLKCVLLALFFVSPAPNAVAYKVANSIKKSKKKSPQAQDSLSSLGAEPVIRDFDKLRGFQSYDPATDKWSIIEDFEAVDILVEDAVEQREDRYIYHSFWAYDVATGCWYKVDIRDHGYGLSKLVATKNIESQKEVPSKSSDFWKNWAMGFRVGTGPTFHENKIGSCIITERDGEDFFLQAQKETGKKSYKIYWFGAGYTECGEPCAGSQGVLDIRGTKADKETVFKGRGWNIPITLFTHYTLFKRLRVGAGCEFSFNHLEELIPKEDASHLKPFKVRLAHRWFYNVAWFGLLGFKVIHAPNYDISVDFQLGKNCNAGVTPKDMFNGKGYLYDGWLWGLGVAYERRLNNYFRFLTRFSGDWKKHDDVPSGIDDPQVSVKLNQLALHLDLGIQVSFGKDTKEDERAEKLDEDYDLTQLQQKPGLEFPKINAKRSKKKLSNTKDRRKRFR